MNTTERGTNAHYIQFSLQYTSSSAYTLQYSLSRTRYLVLIINAVQFSIIQITVEVEAWISTTVVKAVYRVAGTLLRVTVLYISLYSTVYNLYLYKYIRRAVPDNYQCSTTLAHMRRVTRKSSIFLFFGISVCACT